MAYHWTTKRKAAIVKSILDGDTTVEAVAAAIPYGSVEEVAQWVEAWQKDGVTGLAPQSKVRMTGKASIGRPSGR
jgi:transposase-like protein